MGLLFIVFGWKNLLKTITAFTLAHSITLALSVLGIVRLPSGSIEALIALTIIYLAFEINSREKVKSGVLRRTGLIVDFSKTSTANQNKREIVKRAEREAGDAETPPDWLVA